MTGMSTRELLRALLSMAFDALALVSYPAADDLYERTCAQRAADRLVEREAEEEVSEPLVGRMAPSGNCYVQYEIEPGCRCEFSVYGQNTEGCFRHADSPVPSPSLVVKTSASAAPVAHSPCPDDAAETARAGIPGQPGAGHPAAKLLRAAAKGLRQLAWDSATPTYWRSAK